MTGGRPRAFNFQKWTDANQHLLKPPVSNKKVFEDGAMTVQVVGGPNQRTDYHDEPVEEFFYQLKGDMVLKVCDDGKFYDGKNGTLSPAHPRSCSSPVPLIQVPLIPAKAGIQCLMLAAACRGNWMPACAGMSGGGSAAEVVPIREGEVFLLPPHVPHSPQRPQPGSVGLVVEPARPNDVDGFNWYCFDCGKLVHRVEVKVQHLIKDLPPLYDAFYADRAARTCKACGALHPGKAPPAGWVTL